MDTIEEPEPTSYEGLGQCEPLPLRYRRWIGISGKEWQRRRLRAVLYPDEEEEWTTREAGSGSRSSDAKLDGKATT
ncbi:hypothetical protein PSPO01_13925 [Paraphaeosphaeria sporulosa]